MRNGKNRQSPVRGWNAVWGLTGGIGSGKSTVLSMFREKGALTLDADAIVRSLLINDAKVLRKIRRTFGGKVFDGARLDRKALANIVFVSTTQRKKLERIIHPEVRKKIWAELARQAGAVALIDIPLLYESSEWRRKLDGVIVVDAPMGIRIKRLRGRGFEPIDIKRRIGAQMDLRKKVRMADIVVKNGGTIAQTKKQVDTIWKSLPNKTPGGK